MKLPNSWTEIQIGEMAQYINGKAFKPSDWKNTGLPIIRIQNLNDLNAKCNYTNSLIEEKYKIKNGELLFAWSASLGAYIWNGKEACLNQHIFKVVPYKGVNKKYLYYTLVNTVSHFYSKTHGSGIVHITKEPFEKTIATLPPLPEQHRIVNKIDKLFLELNNSVEMLKTIKAQLTTYRQAILKYSFEKEEYKKVKLYEIADIIGGITKGRNLTKYETIFLPYLRVANVQDGYLDLTNIKKIELKKEEKKKYLLQKNDVLYTEGGDKDKLGRGTIWMNEIKECVHQNHIFRARIGTNKADPKYIALFSLTKSAKNYFLSKAKQTVNLASINMTVLRSLPIPLPSISEQQAIVSAIESRLSVCEKLEQTIDQTIALSASLKQSILKKAFEGRLVPQDPNDEPAEKLLERIKAEKAAVLAKQKKVKKRGKK